MATVRRAGIVSCFTCIAACGIESLVAVLRTHVGDGDACVLEQVCKALKWICIDKGAWSWRRGRSVSRRTMMCRPRLELRQPAGLLKSC